MNKPKTKKSMQSMYLSDELKDKLRKKAVEEDRSINYIIVSTLEKAFKEQVK